MASGFGVIPDGIRSGNGMRAWPQLPGTDKEVPPGEMPAARIFRPAPTPGRGGLGRFAKWTLEFERTVPPLIEPLMGWTEGADPFAPVRLHFPNLQSAIEFAECHGWRYEVTDTPPLRTNKTTPATARYDLRDILARVLDASKSTQCEDLRHVPDQERGSDPVSASCHLGADRRQLHCLLRRDQP